MFNKLPSIIYNHLPCKIPEYESQLIKLVKIRNNNQLYIDFTQKFLSYIAIDYVDDNNTELFLDFCEHAFLFFKTRNLGKMKSEFIKTKDGNWTLFLLNDDKPLILDTLNAIFNKFNLTAKLILHPVIKSSRDINGNLLEINQQHNSYKLESLIAAKIFGDIDTQTIDNIQKEINTAFERLELINIFSLQIRKESKLNLSLGAKTLLDNEIEEFLNWLKHDNFTFFTKIDFSLENNSAQNQVNIINVEGVEKIWQDNTEDLSTIIYLANDILSKDKRIILGKVDCHLTIGNGRLVDYILIKNFDKKNNYLSGTIILGLYGADIYYQSVKNIPLLQQKLQNILTRSGFSLDGYNSKKLNVIIESLPRDALIQIDENELYCLCMHMLSSIISRKLKLFIQHNNCGTLINILLFLPRANFSPEIHTKINQYLSEKFHGTVISDYITEVTQHFLYLYITMDVAKLQKIISNDQEFNLSIEDIEENLRLITANWEDNLYSALYNQYGRYTVTSEYQNIDTIFEISYKQKFTPAEALSDITYLKLASLNNRIAFNLIHETPGNFRLKIYTSETKMTLSDMMPVIENLGFIVINEQSFKIKDGNKNIKESFIYEFILSTQNTTTIDDLQTLKTNVEDALYNIFSSTLASDSLGKLIILSGLNWQQVKILKALTRYLHQTGFIYGKGYVQLILIKHYEYTKLLMDFFAAKFDHKFNHSSPETALKLLMNYCDTVTTNSEDKVLRNMMLLIDAITRTNCYQNQDGKIKEYLSFKFNASKVPDLPRPIPYAEIFVYSNDFEGVHLRGGKVARGGLRWSDRGEDYRTEVLGLMKAQMTKNPVIIPVGAKGGFYIMFTQDNDDYNSYMAKVVDCYKNFLRGMLDITDNIVDGKVIHPQNTIIYDEEDPYLVVAADKGTATFSDYANSISQEYNFWLRDAFASGGSSGYDHKKMAITSKGAWISLERHFREMEKDPNYDHFSVVGIGDMSGDVFGNGMMLSKTIKLVAAFNHKHIFLDPTPDPITSFHERERLFNKPKSQWSDYNLNLISIGGGIFLRSQKMIPISKEVQALLKIQATSLTPEDLIKAILQSEVDLIWNGGIGTYFKSSTENHLDIGDKSNDNLRINGCEIRAKVIAEGGNLGASQLARIEYAKLGGRINTDFIDNSAGVDCSDHEVNIKIALNLAIASGKLDIDRRNILLEQMTPQVENLVLKDNYEQNQAISVAASSPNLSIELISKFIDLLEDNKLLDRKVEFLPNKTDLLKRSAAKDKMTRPELAVILSYSKMYVSKELHSASLTLDKHFIQYLIHYFPTLMHAKFYDEILAHPLRDDIIRTVITNKIVNQLGGPIIYNIQTQTNAKLCDIVRSYIIISEIFEIDNLWNRIDNVSNLDLKIEMFAEVQKLLRRGICWFIKHLQHPINIADTITQFKQQAQTITIITRDLLLGEARLRFDSRIAVYQNANIEDDLAYSIASLDSLISVFDIIYVAQKTNTSNIEVAHLYFLTANQLNIDYLRKVCDNLKDSSYWNKLAIQSLKDDLYDKQRQLLIKIIEESTPAINKESFNNWLIKHKKSIDNFLQFIDTLKTTQELNVNMLILINKKLMSFFNEV